MLGALLAAGLDLVIGELVPITDARRNNLLGESKISAGTQRSNFAYAGEYGRVYKALMLDVTKGSLDRLQIERKGNGVDYPTVLISSTAAKYSVPSPKAKGHWVLQQGEMHVVRDTTPGVDISFGEMRDRRMDDLRPVDLMARPRDPQEMRFAELTRFITALERSGGDANLLRVERALKIAIPSPAS